MNKADGGWCISWCKDKYWGEVIAAGCGIDGKVKVRIEFPSSFQFSHRTRQIIQFSPARRPKTLLTLDPSPTRPAGDPAAKALPASTEGALASYAITSVSWAPSCGRSYHLIATGSRDGKVRIWRVKPAPLSDEADYDHDGDGEGEGHEPKWGGATIVGEFDDHKCGTQSIVTKRSTDVPYVIRSSVGRVEWNITGYVLSFPVPQRSLILERLYRTVLSSAGNDGRVRLWKATAGNVWRPAGHIGVEQADEQPPDVDMDENAVAD